jgi:hypothetical protein
MIVPSGADYVCIKCRQAYRWVGQPPRLTTLVPVDDPNDDGDRRGRK